MVMAHHHEPGELDPLVMVAAALAGGELDDYSDSDDEGDASSTLSDGDAYPTWAALPDLLLEKVEGSLVLLRMVAVHSISFC